MIAIDYYSKTYENLHKGCECVLQILHQDHQNLVNLLGKKSGKQIKKTDRLVSKDLLTKWNNLRVLDGACGYLKLEMKGRKNVKGDHELFWFEVMKSKTNSENNILMFQDLIEAGIIL
ncbi:flavin reductase [Ekhidna sp.]|uniref:flavin reductase n=1 Tax=Ekhidna sp. TaxID=2608089 RepID=UPI003B5AE1CB